MAVDVYSVGFIWGFGNWVDFGAERPVLSVYFHHSTIGGYLNLKVLRNEYFLY